MNFLLRNNPNRGTHEFAKLTDFWIVLLGALISTVWERISHSIFYPIFAPVAKGDDHEMRTFNTNKACRYFYQCQYFIIATIWGYHVLKPTGLLPWELGGEISVNESFD